MSSKLKVSVFADSASIKEVNVDISKGGNQNTGSYLSNLSSTLKDVQTEVNSFLTGCVEREKASKGATNSKSKTSDNQDDLDDDDEEEEDDDENSVEGEAEQQPASKKPKSS